MLESLIFLFWLPLAVKNVMSLFARTTADLAAAKEALARLSTSTSPIEERKAEFDALSDSLSKVTIATNKFVSNADAGEADPNKRLYGTGMVAKIRALKADLDDFSGKVEELNMSISEQWNAWEEKRMQEEKEAKEKATAAAEEERLRVFREEEKRREMDERKRLEIERKEAEKREATEREVREKEEMDKVAKLRAEEERKATEEARKREAAERKAKEEQELLEKERLEKEAAASMISITIKTSKGKSFALDALPRDASIGDVKSCIERLQNIPVEAQRLIFQGRLLDNGKNLIECGIGNGVAVHLVENARALAGVGHPGQSPAQPKPTVPPGTLCHLSNGKSEFDTILASCGMERLVVVDWSAPWCGPCRMIAPAFERLAGRFADVTFVKVDTEQTPQNAQLAQLQNIAAYPTFHFYVAGQKVHEFSGASASQIESGIRRFKPAPGSSASSSASTSSGSASGRHGTLTSRVMSALNNLRAHCSTEDFIVAVRTLLTFVRNVTDHPTESRYRRVRTGNNAYQSRVARHGTYGTECMHAFGFESRNEDGEHYLVLSEPAACNPDLRKVKSQLEAAMQAAGFASTETNTSNSGSGGDSAAATHVGGGEYGSRQGTGFAPGMGNFPGVGGAPGGAEMFGMPPMDPSHMQELMTDPAFQEIAQEFATNAEFVDFTRRVQMAMQSGDPSAMMQLVSDPALARLQQLMMRNPSLVERMMRTMGGGAGPGFGGGMPGLGNVMGAMAGMGNAPRADGGQGNAGFTTPTQAPRPSPVPPAAPRHGPAPDPPLPANAHGPSAYPGAPTTQEEEDRLLQEAIRLSMEDANNKNSDRSSSNPHSDDGEGRD